MQPDLTPLLAAAAVALALFLMAEIRHLTRRLNATDDSIRGLLNIVEADADFARERLDTAEAKITELRRWSYFDERVYRDLVTKEGDGCECT